MKRGLTFAAVVIAGGLWMFGIGSAHEDHAKHIPDSKEIIAFRTYLKVNAQAIALHATRIPDLFPQGSTSATSRAKDEIWQKWDEFTKASDALKTETDRLAVMIAEGKTDEATTQTKKVFGACKSCHDSFRKPEKKE